jgi:hypothetical protein
LSYLWDNSNIAFRQLSRKRSRKCITRGIIISPGEACVKGSDHYEETSDPVAEQQLPRRKGWNYKIAFDLVAANEHLQRRITSI